MSNRRFAGPALLLALWLVTSTTPAEVAVAIGAQGHESDNGTLYELRSIIDDPEPVGIVWATLGNANPNRIVLNEQGLANADGKPSMLVTSAGVPLVAWSRNSPDGYDVVVSRFVGGAWTDPQVLAGSSDDELDPHLSMDPDDGTVHLVYWIQDASPRVMHRQAPADLASWSPAVPVSEPGNPAVRPSGVFHAGVLKIVFEVHDSGLGSTPRQIVLASRSDGVFTSETLAVTHHPGENWARVHSVRGRLWIDWIDAAGEMVWICQPQPGIWNTVQIEQFATPEERDYHVRGQIRMLALQ